MATIHVWPKVVSVPKREVIRVAGGSGVAQSVELLVMRALTASVARLYRVRYCAGHRVVGAKNRALNEFDLARLGALHTRLTDGMLPLYPIVGWCRRSRSAAVVGIAGIVGFALAVRFVRVVVVTGCRGRRVRVCLGEAVCGGNALCLYLRVLLLLLLLLIRSIV